MLADDNNDIDASNTNIHRETRTYAVHPEKKLIGRGQGCFTRRIPTNERDKYTECCVQKHHTKTKSLISQSAK